MLTKNLERLVFYFMQIAGGNACALVLVKISYFIIFIEFSEFSCSWDLVHLLLGCNLV